MLTRLLRHLSICMRARIWFTSRAPTVENALTPTRFTYLHHVTLFYGVGSVSDDLLSKRYFKAFLSIDSPEFLCPRRWTERVSFSPTDFRRTDVRRNMYLVSNVFKAYLKVLVRLFNFTSERDTESQRRHKQYSYVRSDTTITPITCTPISKFIFYSFFISSFAVLLQEISLPKAFALAFTPLSFSILV